MKNYLMISVAEVITAFIILLVIKTVRQQHSAGMGEKTGRGIDERLKESGAAIQKAAIHLRSTVEHMTDHKT